jgi:hypothetical protein
MSDPIYNFVSVWTVDDTQAPARPPVVSADLYTSPGSVLSAISTVSGISTLSKTTNVTSQDCYVNSIQPLSDINTAEVFVSGFEYLVPAATGPYTAPGGQISTITVAPTLATVILPA